MRRTHLRGHENIFKRLLLHNGAFNLGLLMRQSFGIGTPRGLQGRLCALLDLLRNTLASPLVRFDVAEAVTIACSYHRASRAQRHRPSSWDGFNHGLLEHDDDHDHDNVVLPLRAGEHQQDP
jgi:hypothetical protein